MSTMSNTAGKSSMLRKNILLVVLVVAIAVIPLLLLKDAEFGGADGRAEQAITEINADYKPWFSPVWEPPSGEIESLLFAMQAALGAGFIGYYIGYVRGRKTKNSVEKS
ncbi:MAG: energy-coupling factor ABC transporter substrate-binding protein [Clostridiales bacterium]|jgi:cobalt/nickel transport protein|nr:energy-coupling factor ABC transporter substrate-binding protein [Eubacteriales bacterium]MDH7566202.1 energy-coupling factor ABC transporter substrate-binding protein [Clostridiales bacterium]